MSITRCDDGPNECQCKVVYHHVCVCVCDYVFMYIDSLANVVFWHNYKNSAKILDIRIHEHKRTHTDSLKTMIIIAADDV